MSTDGPKPGSGTQIAGSSSSTPEPSASASMPAAEAPSLVGQVINGRYRIMRKLGEGGMGEVYAAEHVHIEKHVAIKLLKAEIVSNKEAVARFRETEFLLLQPDLFLIQASNPLQLLYLIRG